MFLMEPIVMKGARARVIRSFFGSEVDFGDRTGLDPETMQQQHHPLPSCY